MRFTIISIVLLLFTIAANGQNPQIDSLETLLKKHSRVDTVQINLLNNLGYKLFSGNPQQAKLYAQKALELSSQIGYPKGTANSMWVFGLLCLRSDKTEAIEYFRKALKISEEIDDKIGICNYLTAIGNTSKDLGDIEASTDAHEKALKVALELDAKPLIIKARINLSRNMNSIGRSVEAAQQLQEVIPIAEEIGDERMLAGSYSNLGVIYLGNGNLSTALEYYLSALHIYEKLNNLVGISLLLSNIAGIQASQNDLDAALKTLDRALKIADKRGDSMQMSTCFTNIGNIYKRMGQTDKALDYSLKALEISKDNNITQNIYSYGEIGEIYSEKGDFESALKAFGEALALAEKLNVKMYICQVHIQLGQLYFNQKNYAKAIDITKNALGMAEEGQYTELNQNCNNLLSQAYATTGDFKKAFTHHKKYKLLQDSIFNEKNTRNLALLESSYKFSKERAVYELAKSSSELIIKDQKKTILSLAAISSLIILLSVTIYRSVKMKKKVLQLEIENINEELEANQKAMAVAQLKLVQNAERDVHAVKMLEDIGQSVGGAENQNLHSLINDYKFQSNHSNWEEFETLFTKVNTSFWDKLNELYPDLTPNERKLCVFLKLNMSNKDIALITFQSEEALKKSRMRLRKKLNIDRSTNLVAFIQSL